MLTQQDVDRTLHERVVSLVFRDGKMSYRTNKPESVHLTSDGMVRIYTLDGVSHTMRPWYTAVRLIYDDGVESEITVMPGNLHIGTPGISLIPKGIRRVVGTAEDVYQAYGPMWFHYDDVLGTSVYFDLSEGLRDEVSHTYLTRQEGIYWWRDEPVNSIFF